jgi:hypothetical protein
MAGTAYDYPSTVLGGSPHTQIEPLDLFARSLV